MKKEVVDINMVLLEVLEIVKFDPSLPKSIQQKTDLKARGFVYIHHGKIKQAFLNMIINAYQAMSGDSGGVIHVSTHEDSKYIFVAIGDMGEGMDEAVMGRIFEPFYTTKSKGTGLGLAVTYKIFGTS